MKFPRQIHLSIKPKFKCSEHFSSCDINFSAETLECRLIDKQPSEVRVRPVHALSFTVRVVVSYRCGRNRDYSTQSCMVMTSVTQLQKSARGQRLTSQSNAAFRKLCGQNRGSCNHKYKMVVLKAHVHKTKLQFAKPLCADEIVIYELRGRVAGAAIE